MAQLFFNNAVNTSANTLGNWWDDEACTDPAAALPAPGDDAVIKSGAVLATGTLTCDLITINGDVGVSEVSPGPTLNASNYISLVTVVPTIFGTIYSGIFNGDVVGTFAASIFGGVFNGGVFGQMIESNLQPSSIGIEINCDALPASVSKGGSSGAIRGTGRISFDGGSTYMNIAPPDFPSNANVKVGVVFNDGGNTGTYDGSDRHTDPGEANVRSGIAYKANSATNNKTGALNLPAEADVREGTTYDNGTKTGLLAAGGGWQGGPLMMGRR